MVRATAKKDGYTYATASLETATPSHALALARDAAVDLAQDISDYDLTSAGPAAKGVYVAPQASGASKYVYFADTYDLKASPEKSKRVLDAALGTDDGLRLLHRYAQAPSLNNNGRVVSFHATYVNILTGWIEFVRKAGLPPNSRAVFGAATYTGDDETFYRPPELNGGHVEVADPTVYVQFDSARIRRVTQEVISDADNQAAIASAVLGAIPEGDEDSDPATTKTVSNVLYELRNGPGGTATVDTTDLAQKILRQSPEAENPATNPSTSLGRRIADMDAVLSGGFVRDTTNPDNYNVRGASPTLTATATVSDSDIRTALAGATLPAVPTGTPTTLGGVLALLARMELVEDAGGGYDVRATLASETVRLPTSISVNDVKLSADGRRDLLRQVPEAESTDAPVGSIGRLIADSAAKAKKLQFNDANDVMATLGDETVSLSTAERTSMREEMEKSGTSLAAVKAKTDDLEFVEVNGRKSVRAREQDPLMQRREPPQATAVAQAIVENATWLEMRRDIALARKMQTNRQLRDGTASRYTTYDDDGTTPIVSHDLKDSEGAPAEHNEPYERVRRTA